jgi:HlyD family secretion protein
MKADGNGHKTEKKLFPEVQAPRADIADPARPAEPVVIEGPVHLPAMMPVPEPGPRRRFRRGLALAALVVGTALAGAAYWYWLTPATPVERYKTVRVDRGPISAVVTATGTVNPVITVQVGSQVSGIIKALYADFNSIVKAGQVVAQVDPEPFEAKVDQARANLKTAQSNLVKARTDLAQRKLEMDRMVELRGQDFVAQSDLDLAVTNYRDAIAQVDLSIAGVDQAAAVLDSAKLDLKHCTINSPVDGIVVSRNVDVGQTVAASLQAPTLFLIAQDLTHMQVDANVSESDIGGVAEGKDAEFTVDAYPNQPFKGTVVQVRNAPISIQNVVTYDVVIGADNRALKLKPGMTANVSIVTLRKDQVLRVPNAAPRFKLPGAPIERQKAVVWKLDNKGMPRPITFQAGIVDSAFTEVVGGDIHEGDAVIVGVETVGEQEQKALPPGFGGGPPMR